MNEPDTKIPQGHLQDPELQRLADQLRQLRLADPASALRRQVLGAVSDTLTANAAPPWSGWWREAALAAATVILFAAPSAPALPDRVPATPATREIAAELGLGPSLGSYLERRAGAKDQDRRQVFPSVVPSDPT